MNHATTDPASASNTLARHPTSDSGHVPSPDSGRLVSLDVFRGITIAAMLLVNNPGSWSHVHPPLRHAEWHGWTPTDLIFPFFLFIVGVAMTYSFGKRLRAGADRRRLLVKAARRAAVLVVLGLLLHAFPWWDVDLESLRLPGVLQRIGVAYFAASMVVLYTSSKGRVAATFALLLGYWAIMALVPVPGYGAGNLTPEGNPAAYLDRLVFGTEHLWQYSRTWDPEGLLSTLPAVASVLAGVLAGHWIRGPRGPARTTAGLLTAGIAAIAAGSLWGTIFPINKNLWTSSYAVFTSGMALLFLAICYWMVDVRRWRGWTGPFVFFGMNAIAAYFLSGIFARITTMIEVADGVSLKTWVYEHLFASWAGPVHGSLAYALVFVLIWLGPMWVLYRKRIFLKV